MQYFPATVLVLVCARHVIGVTSDVHLADQGGSSVQKRDAPLGAILTALSGHSGPLVPTALNYAQAASRGQGRICNKVPNYLKFNLSSDSYNYPRNNIYQELTDRKDVLSQIYKDGVKAISPAREGDVLFTASDADLQSSVGDGVQGADPYHGCTGYRVLLRKFSLYGGHCWLVYPTHQAVGYVICGNPRCHSTRSGTPYGACAVTEADVSVWAWCETLDYGKRVTKVTITVPIGCHCQSYSC